MLRRLKIKIFLGLIKNVATGCFYSLFFLNVWKKQEKTLANTVVNTHETDFVARDAPLLFCPTKYLYLKCKVEWLTTIIE